MLGPLCCQNLLHKERAYTRPFPSYNDGSLFVKYLLAMCYKAEDNAEALREAPPAAANRAAQKAKLATAEVLATFIIVAKHESTDDSVLFF